MARRRWLVASGVVSHPHSPRRGDEGALPPSFLGRLCLLGIEAVLRRPQVQHFGFEAGWKRQRARQVQSAFVFFRHGKST